MHTLSTYMHHYDELDFAIKYLWGANRRGYMGRQLYIKDIIVDALFQQPQQPWISIELVINSWCSFITIEIFVKYFDSIGYYKERIITKLSPKQQKKHLEFSKLVHERRWDF